MMLFVIAIIIVALMLMIETTGNLKLIWGVVISLVAYEILFFIDVIRG